MIVSRFCNMSSENFSLYMSYKRKTQIFRNYHIIFRVTLLLSGKLL